MSKGNTNQGGEVLQEPVSSSFLDGGHLLGPKFLGATFCVHKEDS